MNKNVNSKNVKRGLVPYLLMFLLIIGVFYIFNVMNTDIKNLTYNEFSRELEKGNIKEITITARSSAKTYEITGSFDNSGKKENFFARIPMSEVQLS